MKVRTMITYLPTTNLNLKLRHCQEGYIYNDVPIIGWAANHYGIIPISLVNLKSGFCGARHDDFAIHDAEACATHIHYSDGNYVYTPDNKNGGFSW